MDDIKQSISNYLESSDEFALLIDGGWGTGKTHFIQNELLNNVDDIEEHSNNKTSIYTSLYGQESVGEIKKIITTQLLNIVQSEDKSILKGATALAKYIEIPVIDIPKISGDLLNYMDAKSISTIQKSLAKHENRFVIVIDDLERITDVNEINELFGFVRNELLDTLKVKVILIGNMNELNDRFCGKIDKTKFNKSKEKVIGKTIEFVNNVENGIKLIQKNLGQYFNVEQITEDLKSFLEKNILIEDSNKIYDDSAYKMENKEVNESKEFTNNPLNLRTLKLVISDYKTIYKFAKEELKDDMTEDIKLSMFYSLFIINNEYRNGNFDDGSIGTLLKYISPFEDDRKFIYERYYKNENVKRLIYMHGELLNYVLFNRANLTLYVQDLYKHIMRPIVQKENVLDKLERREFYNEFELKEYLNNALTEFRKVNKVEVKLHYLITFLILEDDGLFLLNESTDGLLNELIDSYDIEQYKKLSEKLSTSLNLQFRRMSKKNILKQRLQEKEEELIKVDEVEFLKAILNDDQIKIREIKNISFTKKDPNVYQYILDNPMLVESHLNDSIQSVKNLNAFLVDSSNSLDVKVIGEQTLNEYIEYMESLKKSQDDKVKQHFINWLIKNAQRIQTQSS